MTAAHDVADRIKKLLALAEGEGTNPNEAAVAAATAVTLMERHGLERAELEAAIEPDIGLDVKDPLFVGADGVTQISSWRSVLANKLSRLEGCRAVEQRALDRRGNVECARLVLVGRPEELAVTRYLYRYLEREIERLCEMGRQRGRLCGRSAMLSFRMAVIKTVDERLQQAKRQARAEHVRDGGTTTAIERVDGRGDEVERWLKEALKVEPEQYDRSSYDPRAAAAGQRAGKRIPLHPGMAQARNARRIAAR